MHSRTFASRTLWNVAWRTLRRRPWQTSLMILGITLGVAVVVAVDLANASAGRAFDLSTEAVVGRATHEIVAGPDGLDESLYVDLRRQGALAQTPAAPVVTGYVSSPQLGDRPFQLLGVDAFAEVPFRDHLWRAGDTAGLTDFLTEPGALLVAAHVADRYGLARGDRITLDAGGFPRDTFVAGVLQPAGSDLNRRALDGILLADVATAQELLGRVGRLDRVDLILPDDPASVAEVRALLPPGVRVEPVAARAGALRQMTTAFRTNLVALSLLALFVGLFLIYNAMTFSVVQRRPLFGTLRCLGVTPGEIFALVIGEALVVGVVGAGLGLLLGVAMGQNAVDMVTQTVNDLYFVLTVRAVGVPPESLVKGALMGVFATMLAAALPAWEAASVPPRAALSRSGLETKTRRAVGWAALSSVVVLILGLGTLLLPTRDLWVSFGSLAAVVLAFGLLTPLATVVVMRAAGFLLGRVWGARGRMAPRDVVNSLSRTSIAVAALMIAVAVTIGVGLMIDSFRGTVVTWLDYALQGDVYVWAPSFKATQNTSDLAPTVVEIVSRAPGVARVDLIRATVVDSPNGPIYIEAGNSTSYGEHLRYKSADGTPAEIWPRVRDDGAVIVSEPLATRLGLPPRDGRLTLYTDRGPHTFDVVGIYYDYTSSEGGAIMALAVYRRLWDDEAVTGLAAQLAPGADPDAVAQDLEDRLAPVQRVSVWPNQALQEDALKVFDRTFAITGALQMLATVVAFIGVLSALLSLQLDKRRQFGVLRAVGLTTRELWGLVLLETGLMGAVAGLLAMPAGYVIALILIYVINQRSFGWTLQMQMGPAPFAEALAVALAAALLAGIYPAYRMGRTITAEALRYE